jgi:hypothetical protein
VALENGVAGVVLADFRDEFSVIAKPRHKDSEKLLAFWSGRAPDGIVMGRDVPSRAIAPILSHIVVWEPLEDLSDMRIRLAGAALARRFPGDLRGRLMSELFQPADFAVRLPESLAVIDSGTPLILDSRVVSGTIERIHLEVVVLPILSPDRKRGWLLTGTSYFD